MVKLKIKKSQMTKKKKEKKKKTQFIIRLYIYSNYELFF
jgi:hypothetical protein